MQPKIFTDPFFVFFAELFGVSDSPSGYFLDTGQSGLLRTIDKLTAEQASAGGEAGETTTAAHCNHILFLLNFFATVERGEKASPDWESSWAVSVVDDASWQSLRSALRSAYNDIVARLTARNPWPDEAVGPTMLLLVHCAYHLGEIRQRLNWIDRA
jgi:hypothetical protein